VFVYLFAIIHKNLWNPSIQWFTLSIHYQAIGVDVKVIFPIKGMFSWSECKILNQNCDYMEMESYVVLRKKKFPLEDCNELGFIFSTLSVEITTIDANNIC